MSATVSLSPSERRALLGRGFRTVAMLAVSLGVTLFLSAGTLRWPAAWVFLLFWAGQFSAWILWGARNKPGLLLERAKSLEGGGKDWDKIFIVFNWLSTLAGFAVAGLDVGRFHWSDMNPIWQITGLVLFVPGYLLALRAVMSNPFASGVVRIQADRGHRVISAGPYQYVRHPMYIGNMLTYIGIPLFLGSYWALIPGLFLVALLTYRTAREDKTLQEELAGYEEYTRQVRYRLIPGIW